MITIINRLGTKVGNEWFFKRKEFSYNSFSCNRKVNGVIKQLLKIRKP